MPTLQAFELPFAYEEGGERKTALVKVKLCERCARKLMWKKEAGGEDDKASRRMDRPRSRSPSRRHRKRGS
jgi:protein FRA10AC1